MLESGRPRRLRMALAGLLAISSFLLAAAPGHANGSMSICYPGYLPGTSCDVAKISLNGAIELALADPAPDTIHVGPGTFTGSDAKVNRINTGPGLITIVGTGQSTTTIADSDEDVLVRLKGNFALSDLSLNLTGGSGYGLRLEDNATAQRVTVQRTGAGSGAEQPVLSYAGSAIATAGLTDVTVNVPVASSPSRMVRARITALPRRF